MTENQEQIKHDDELIALIIRNNYNSTGVDFFTPDSFSQQLAFINHPKDTDIKPHIHTLVKREVFYTQEVLIIRKGKLKVDLYTNDKQYVCSRILCSGDVILLASGGHGFKMIEDTEMIEVKQGPYIDAESDKERFEGVKHNDPGQ